MAIHVMNPNTIGTQTASLYSVTNIEGKNLIDSFAKTIEDLKSHWRGTDAVANLTDLSNVYTAVTDFIKGLQKLIVAVNNDEVLPLQKHIQASGGTCQIGEELSFSLNMDSVLAAPTASVESWTDPKIITDAENFTSFPQKFQTFVGNLNEAKQTLLNNWLEGGNRMLIEKTFAEFNNSVPNYQKQLETVRNNLNIVSENKKQLM